MGVSLETEVQITYRLCRIFLGIMFLVTDHISEMAGGARGFSVSCTVVVNDGCSIKRRVRS